MNPRAQPVSVDAALRRNILVRVFADENTPTRLPPPPRAVHGGVGCGLWFIRLFILPHMGVGVFLIAQFASVLLVAMFGTDTAAIVTKAHTYQGSKGGITYHLGYRYRAGGREYTDSEAVGAGTYAAVSHPGDLEGRAETVRVREFALGPLHCHLLTQERSAWGAVGTGLCFALFWNWILSVFVAVAWVVPIRRRNLIRHGLATQGTITDSRVNRGRSYSYYASFSFSDPVSGRELKREMQLPGKAQYTEAQHGRAVTVLYNPRNPKRALVYELCGYHVAGAESA